RTIVAVRKGRRKLFKIILLLAAAGVALVVLLWLLNSLYFHLLEDPAAALAKEPTTAPETGMGDVRSLNAILEPIRHKVKLPALVAAAIQNGKLTALGAVGTRRAGHAERVSLSDRFHLGSCTKSMTATLCAMLIEQGKLKWETTIAESFPEL